MIVPTPRHVFKRTRSVLRGVTTLERGNDQREVTIVPIAPRSALYTSRDKRLERARLRPWEAPPRLRRSAVAQQTWWERTCPRMQYFSHAYASDVLAFSRTSPLPQNPVSSVVYRLFDKSGLVREKLVHPTKMQRLKLSIRGQVRSHFQYRIPSGRFVYNDERSAWECLPGRSASALECGEDARPSASVIHVMRSAH